MALQADRLVMSDFALLLRLAMRAMAGDARKILRLLITAAVVHLLHVSHDRHVLVFALQAVVVPEILQAQTGAEIPQLRAAGQNPRPAREMALLANRL